MAQNIQTHSVNIGGSNSNCGDTIPSYSKIVYKSDEDSQIMHSLSPPDPNSRNQGVPTKSFDGVRDYTLEAREFQE